MEIRHGRVSLWLDRVREGEGTPLLVLHELGSDGAAAVRALSPGLHAWPGPVFALDFCGHGRSGRVRSGAYYPELLAADADVALAAIGSPLWVSGEGLGAYVALLLAGARPDAVLGAVLWPGKGLEGGGAEPDFRVRPAPRPEPGDPADPALQDVPSTDPRVARSLAEDVRPLDYVSSFAADAMRLVLVEAPSEPPRELPAWWGQARSAPRVRAVSGAEATPEAVLAWAAAAMSGSAVERASGEAGARGSRE